MSKFIFDPTAEHKIEIRTPRPEELTESERVEREVWSFLPPDANIGLDEIYSIFPEGFLTAFVDGRGAGNFYSIRLNYDMENPVKTWDEVSDNGRGQNHVPTGETLYGLGLGVTEDYRGIKLGARLVQGQLDVCKKLNCQRFVLGCRIPDYHKYSNIPVEEYITLKNEKGDYLDSELRFYSRCGLKFTKPLPEYMSGANADPESLNYGVLSIWENPYYQDSALK